MTHNAADRKSIQAAKKRARQEALAEGEVMRSLCSTIQGRQWVWNRLSECQVFTALYPDQPNLGALLGERNVGLRLLAQVMSHCPELYLDMQREANERRNADAARELAGSTRAGRELDQPDDDDLVEFPASDDAADYAPDAARPN